MSKKKLLFIIVLYLSLFGIVLIYKNQKQQAINTNLALTSDYSEKIEENEEILQELEDSYVHISGEINFPGLIKIENGERLFEVIEKAGGMTEQADVDKINLSIKLSDQDKIYIPKIGENKEYLTSSSPEIINLNTCTKEELMNLDGVGEKTAEKIIEYREKNRFEKIEDLMNVDGIGSQKFEKLKENITI